MLDDVHCVHELAAACQRFVGAISIIEPGIFVAAVRQLVADLPFGETDLEAFLIWNAISSTAWRGAVAHHQLFHRCFGGACTFLPPWLAAPSSFAVNCVREALLQWAHLAMEAFDRVHEWPVALRAAALLQEDALAVWYVPDLARLTGASCATLERNFRQIYGLTPQKYHALLRVLRTADALRSDPGSSEGVVMSVGWPSLNAFAHALRNLAGLRVSALRECTDEEFARIVRGPLALPIPQQRAYASAV
jgi:AraC-like DNA-binding protein